MKSALSLVRGSWLACALISGPALADTACNKQPVPPQSVEAIGRDMIVNGVPTSVVGVQFAGTPDDVSKAFREFWTDQDVPAKGQSGPSGLLLSALDDHCLYVLTLPPQANSEGTRGLLSVIRLGSDPVRHQVPDSAVPLPDGSKTVSDVESRDSGQTGRTWLLEMSGNARENAQQYRDQLAEQGWLSVARAPSYQSGASQQNQGAAVVMQRGSDSVDASFSDRNGKTVAVVNATRNR
jgi:hypothetical protein